MELFKIIRVIYSIILSFKLSAVGKGPSIPISGAVFSHFLFMDRSRCWFIHRSHRSHFLDLHIGSTNFLVSNSLLLFLYSLILFHIYLFFSLFFMLFIFFLEKNKMDDFFSYLTQ